MLSVFVAAWLPGPPPLSAQEAGARSFDRALVLEDSAATSANVSIGDVNGDKRLDLVLVKGRHWPLEDRVLLGDGVGGFADAYSVSPTADRSYSGVLVDMDGDGDLDIVVSNDEPDPKVVHLNDGSGRFTVGSTFGEPEWSTRHVTVADLDRDGHVDAVLANRYGPSSGPSFACFGDGVGGFARPCRIVSEGSATTITTADVNGDDWPDWQATFDVAVFTNLTHDHLDFHGSMEAYRETKTGFLRRHLASGSVAVKRGVGFLVGEQEEDGVWYGRWGCNYIYGTWLALSGLKAAGCDLGEARFRRLVRANKSLQAAVMKSAEERGIRLDPGMVPELT